MVCALAELAHSAAPAKAEANELKNRIIIRPFDRIRYGLSAAYCSV
jgi:hypothetical protein